MVLFCVGFGLYCGLGDLLALFDLLCFFWIDGFVLSGLLLFMRFYCIIGCDSPGFVVCYL